MPNATNDGADSRVVEHTDPSVVSETKISDPWTVEKAVAAIPDKSFKQSTSPVQFFHILERLKTTKRQGWRRFGINHGESIADHSYRMALISMFAPPSLDIPKCIKMSLIHDLAESLVGDITPADGVPKPEKNRREEITMDYLTGEILGRVAAGIIGNDILALWKEHEEGKTMESKFVQDVDKVELLIQMMDYERRGNGGLNLSEFTYVATKLHLPETKGWAEEILKSRDEFWSGKGVAYKGEDSVSHQVRKMQDQYYSGTEQGDANVYPEGALSLNQE